MSNKLKLGLALFALGLLGVLSMLTVTIPLDNLPPQILERYSAELIKLLTLINPAILLSISILIGINLYQHVNLSVPTLSAALKIDENPSVSFPEQLKSGIQFGILSGILLSLLGYFSKSILPQEFIEIGEKIKLTVLAKVLYGGITEELLTRFGFMTLMVWVVYKITKNLNEKTYWIGIILATLLFALGHFPVVYATVSTPSITLLGYVLIGNSIAGIFFGWLYWKKGLESAMIAHICTHLVMIGAESLM